MSKEEPILSVENIHVSFGKTHVLKGLDLDIYAGEVIGFVGGSGTGKSVLMRTILGLNSHSEGQIHLFGQNYGEMQEEESSITDRRIGVLFQHGALFSALTVKENIQVPMREYLSLDQQLMDELAALKLNLVGLPPDAGDKYPNQLSGGMIKRASLARALALDPDLVFLDEPTSGLDPIGASQFDSLIRSLSESLGLTVFMVTHDLGSIRSICDRIAVLRDGKVLAIDTLSNIEKVDDEWVQSYFNSQRVGGSNPNNSKLAMAKKQAKG